MVEIVNWQLDHRLNEFGVTPRTTQGLIGIVLSPFLHTGFDHLFVNTLPVLFLGTFAALQGRRPFLLTILIIIIGEGFLLWCFGRPAVHVGASGLAFGLFGYLVARAWYHRGLWSLAVGVVVVVFYGGLLVGLSPPIKGMSWEGHLFGLIAGVLSARILWRRKVDQSSNPAR